MPPLQVQSARMCFVNAAANTVRVAVERRRIFRVGPNAAINRGGALVILARDHEVRIFAHRGSQARRAATKLQIANAIADSGTLAGRLPTAPRAADQRVPCDGNPPGIVTLPPGVVPKP
jgi:hypothetical protein